MTTLEAVIVPGIQVYCAAPVALRVSVCPEHIEAVELLALTVGNGTTESDFVIELVQVPLLPTIV